MASDFKQLIGIDAIQNTPNINVGNFKDLCQIMQLFIYTKYATMS